MNTNIVGYPRGIAMKQIMKRNKGFTLVEVLVVMALTVIVLGLIFGPIMESSSFTRRAGTLIRAQDNARGAMTRIKRELQSAMYVYDNTRQGTSFYVANKNGVVPDPSDPNSMPIAYGARIDFVMPKMHGFCTQPDSVHGADNPREFARGEDAAPHCKYDGSLLELRPVQPLAPDTNIVRYFIGLNNPTEPYSNRYTKTGTNRHGDNMFILYRVEFSPYDKKLFDQSKSMSENLAKPNFFYDNRPNGITNPDGTPQTYAQAWKRISVALVTPKDVDLVTIDFDADGNPLITPTVTFAPSAVTNDPLLPVTNSDNDPEGSDSDVPPTVYKAKYGSWVLPYEITLRRKQPGDETAIIYKAMQRVDGQSSDMCIYRMKPNAKDPDTLVFDITNYERTKADTSYRGYPFGVGDVSIPDDPGRLPELAFTVDTRGGKVNFAFPHIDLDASEDLSDQFDAKFPVSIVIPTDDINEYYDAAPFQDRYRLWEFHHPANRTLPYVRKTISASRMLGNSSVVLGLERVLGPYTLDPDRTIPYSRIPFYDMLNEPGPNQYKLDVDYPVRDEDGDLISGMDGTAAIYFHSAVTEYGVGIPLPADRNIYLLYYEQNNKVGDSLRANYVTKELVTITVGMRMYDASTKRPQSLQLVGKVRLKNIIE